MSKKIYLVGKKVDGGVCMVPTQAFPSFESAKKYLLEHKPYDRRIEATDVRNEFRITDTNGNYLQTTVIRDVWMNEE